MSGTADGRTAFVHAAIIAIQPGGDPAAVGAAITVELCGHWEHDGPCRWPHNTATTPRADGHVDVRTVFAAPAGDETPIRDRIRGAIHSGQLDGPNGHTAWAVVEDRPASLDPPERDLALRLAG